jgi:hypothetical protein
VVGGSNAFVIPEPVGIALMKALADLDKRHAPESGPKKHLRRLHVRVLPAGRDLDLDVTNG